LEKDRFQIVVHFYISSSNGWTEQSGEPKPWKFVEEFEWEESKTMGEEGEFVESILEMYEKVKRKLQ
jgi:hypothetical protein